MYTVIGTGAATVWTSDGATLSSFATTIALIESSSVMIVVRLLLGDGTTLASMLTEADVTVTSTLEAGTLRLAARLAAYVVLNAGVSYELMSPVIVVVNETASVGTTPGSHGEGGGGGAKGIGGD